MTTKQLYRWLTAIIGFVAATFSAFAQETDSDDEDDIFVLSPFTVNSSSDEGYRATQTLAGSRLNTDLKDIGSAISVVTEEFLDDIGAKDAQDVLVYLTGSEVGGIGGNFAGDTGDFNGTIQRPERATRVRGLGAADLARNFYLTDIPFDTYNTNRIEMQRGANAILFGLGSPAGIINNSLVEAGFFNSGEIQARTDSFGSLRGSFNLNRELIDDKLAVFVAGLYEDREYEQKDRRPIAADRVIA